MMVAVSHLRRCEGSMGHSGDVREECAISQVNMGWQAGTQHHPMRMTTGLLAEHLGTQNNPRCLDKKSMHLLKALRTFQWSFCGLSKIIYDKRYNLKVYTRLQTFYFVYLWNTHENWSFLKEQRYIKFFIGPYLCCKSLPVIQRMQYHHGFKQVEIILLQQ